MRVTMTMLELLALIKKTRKEADEIYKEYIDPAENSRSLVSLYNINSGKTVNGNSKVTVEQDIQLINAKVEEVIEKLQKLLVIKEQVNASTVVDIVNMDGKVKSTMSIAQVLMMKSDPVRNFKIGYLKKQRDDYAHALSSLSLYQETVMSHDKIDRYVIAKMNSLNIDARSSSDETYSKFAKEYRDANQMQILDPLSIRITIDDKLKKAQDFYDKLDLILLDFNVKTKIWIDLEADYGNLWGFVNS